MNAITSKSWTPFSPPLRSAASKARLGDLAKELAVSKRASVTTEDLSSMRDEFLESVRTSALVDKQALLCSGLILVDLAAQGWRIRSRSGAIAVSPPEQNASDPAAEKLRIRKQELIKRDAQLRQPSVQSFLQSMERPRLFSGRFVSVFSLMRDGRELAAKLREARNHRENGWAGELGKAVDPYLEFVKSDSARCPHTGMRLMDIWRYFRHTWSNQYTSVPGRSMLFLVRDRAVPPHPIVGIGALCSPIMQLRERDECFGWQPETFVASLREGASLKLARWLERTLDNAIAEIYVEDFVAESLISVRDLKAPTPAVIKKLLEVAADQRNAHHRFARQRDHKTSKTESNRNWESKARSHLFRSKRAMALSQYLRARAAILDTGSGRLTAKRLRDLAASTKGSDAIRTVLRKAKADRVGICVADISVCGAVQPYNALLGGKLVSMLAASPEVVAEYRQRYKNAESEIASSMAGRAIAREPDLVLLGTTSLYGIGSSQYNRIAIPADRLGGESGESIRFEKLGHSDAFGTSQYADDTVDALTELAQQSANGMRVNSIFGEGVSPKLRKIRQGLDLLQLPGDALLRHHRHRIVYAVRLIRNLREYLLGLDPQPDYIVANSRDTSERVCEWWRERWLRKRIELEEVLAEVERHTLVRPIRHGARVKQCAPSPQSVLPLDID